MAFLAELKRRNVIRMAGLYLIGAWLIVQVSETLLPIFGTPDWVLKTLVLLLALGFVPALVFAWVFELTPEGLKRDRDVPVEQSVAPRTGRRMDRVIIALLLVALGFFAFERFALAPRHDDAPTVSSKGGGAAPVPTPSTAVAGAGAAAPAKSIAVLPFVNMSADPENEYFSDGISEEILNALAKLGDLKVAGRTSSFHFKGRNESLPAIGAALGVAHVLEGSVRRQGDKVRITAQLVQVSDGFHLWSETYDGSLDDVFELQERIARSITDALEVVLQGGQARRLVNVGTENAEAYALYLQATGIFNRREGLRFEEAFKQLERAIALDPAFARAHSRLATLYAVVSNYRNVDVDKSVAAVMAHAERATELDPTLAEPHAAVGLVLNNERRFVESGAAFARATALDPDDVTTNFWHGIALYNTGYYASGKAAFDDALRVDPLLPNGLLWRGRAHVGDGELERAERMFRQAAEGGHSFVAVGFSWLEQVRGNRDAAIAQLARGLESFVRDEFGHDATTVFARACFGDPDARAEMLAIIDRYLATKPRRIAGVVPYVLIRSGELERGFALMGNGPTSNDSLVAGEVMGQLMPEARRSPHFAEFARRMGWAALWDAKGAPDFCTRRANGDYACE
ncbi:MAG TPA: hypothetical protein VFO79_11695 [Xanthomonadales bacterium]|nr:hypothetical protein [Xanthomonadales bacterium]